MAHLPRSSGTCNISVWKCLDGLGVRGDRLIGPLDRFDDDLAGIRCVTPFADPDPFLGLEVLIVGEEMLDLLEDDRRKVLPLADI
jgi:hypothetical protein